MTAPALAGRADEEGSRFYTWGEEQYWSVTTIIGRGMPKHLAPWAAKLVAELAWEDMKARPHGRNAASLRRWARNGRAYVEALQAAGGLTSVKLERLTPEELGLRWLKGEPDRVRDAAADRGRDVHAEAEDLVLAEAETLIAYAAGGGDLGTALERDWPESFAAWMRSFGNFVEDWRPEFLAAEATVFNTAQAYAGTLDAIAVIPRLDDALPGLGLGEVPLVIDYKSGNRLYPEVAIQLSAYARGEFVGLPDGVTEAPLPEVSPEYGLALHLRPATRQHPRGYRLRPVRIGQDVFAHFLFARENFRWVTETSKAVLLDELALEVA